MTRAARLRALFLRSQASTNDRSASVRTWLHRAARTTMLMRAYVAEVGR